MLLKLTGQADEALAGEWSHPFQDAGWASSYRRLLGADAVAGRLIVPIVKQPLPGQTGCGTTGAAPCGATAMTR